MTAEADAHARADEHDHKAESRRSAGATGLLAPVATDDAVEDFSRGLGGVRFVEEMGEIRAVHYVLSKRRGGSFASCSFETVFAPPQPRPTASAIADGSGRLKRRLPRRHTGIEAAGEGSRAVLQEGAQEEGTSW